MTTTPPARRPYRYLLAGGGTAGHVNPLLAVADGLRARDPEATVLVLGTAEGLESRLVPRRGYPLLIVDKVPFPRRLNRAALTFPGRFRRAVAQVRRHLNEHEIDVVIGFGGYASAPAYLAAHRAGISYLVHEANAKPGLANVFGARRAAAVGVAFPGTPLRAGELVGMPLRTEITGLDRAARRAEAAQYYGLDPNRNTLLVFGGSLGAARLNEAFVDAGPAINGVGWQLVHIVGDRSSLSDSSHDGIVIRRYEDRMDLAFALADLVVSRAGAATVSEISALGIPAVYVPYAVGNGEQAQNAADSVRRGAAILIPDSELTGDRVRSEIISLLHDRTRQQAMRDAAQNAGIRQGTQNMITLIDRVL